MTGVTGMNNILLIHLFDRLLSDIPHQEQGYYLSENQSWERAFVNAWRKHSHGRIIGVAHSTIRYWDLRYYDESMTSIIPDLPKPDVLAVNGSAALLNLQKAGYPMEQCVQVEALRYLYLNKLRKDANKKVAKRGEKLLLLLLGDIKKGTTHRLMLMVEKVFEGKKFPYEVWIKPHPHNHIELKKYSKLEAKYMDVPLSELIPMTHVAFSSVFTSAALDIFCAGIPVINYLDPYDLNFSSIRGFDGANYVSSTEEFLQALKDIKSRECKTVNPEDFFMLNAELPNWKALLEGKLIPLPQNELG
jgi:surface carbohydrate biosynthesis protein (TIGR04326 family)